MGKKVYGDGIIMVRLGDIVQQWWKRGEEQKNEGEELQAEAVTGKREGKGATQDDTGGTVSPRRVTMHSESEPPHGSACYDANGPGAPT